VVGSLSILARICYEKNLLREEESFQLTMDECDDICLKRVFGNTVYLFLAGGFRDLMEPIDGGNGDVLNDVHQ
jgi:hypothetical protein